MVKQPFIILKQTQIFSKYGGTVWRIDMVGVRDRADYVTYVDPRNSNYEGWAHIIRNREHGFVIRMLKEKKDKDGLISADSRPIIEWQHDDKDVILKQLADLWQDQDADKDPTTFRDLFK